MAGAWSCSRGPRAPGSRGWRPGCTPHTGGRSSGSTTSTATATTRNCRPASSAGTTIVDWDDPGSWNAVAAVRALEDLVASGTTEVPVYDIARSAAAGTARISAPPDSLVVAEGIFAAEIIGALADAGILHSAWCVRHPRWVTFGRRLVRDLAERRKPPLVLLRRGMALTRAEPEVVARMEHLGATCASPAEVERRLRGQSRTAHSW